MAVVLVTLALAACASPVVTPTASSGYSWHALELARPYRKPDITLTDQNGRTYNLRSQTSGKLVALYFGYSHCPDACPATMATLALALRRLSPADRAHIDVVFITTDPARDTPAVLKSWLAAFDPSFVGLTETGVSDTNDALIRQAEVLAHVAVGQVEQPDANGNYGVDHSTYVLLYSPKDDLAHLGFLYQATAQRAVTAAGEAADLRELVEHGFHP